MEAVGLHTILAEHFLTIKYPISMKKNIVYTLVLSLFALASCTEEPNIYVPPTSGNDDTEVITINTLTDLVKYAAMDSVNVRMAAGTYTFDTINVRIIEGAGVTLTLPTYDSGELTGTSEANVLLNFSGSNSTYDFTGVTINISTQLHQLLGEIKLYEVFVSGDNNVIDGLETKDSGGNVWTSGTSGAIMWVIYGDGNEISNVSLFVEGSYPYGYGKLLGKSTDAIVQPHKHSSFLITGEGTTLDGCSILTHAFGHGFVLQGAVNTLIMNCSVEGKLRPTNEILAETSGPAYDVGFRSQYPPNETIGPDAMIALSEDGFRTYADSPLQPTKTAGLTVQNCTSYRMRSGFIFPFLSGASLITDCTALEYTENGYNITSESRILRCKGDALYGSLIDFPYKTVSDCHVELELINTETLDYTRYWSKRLAGINGTGHTITIDSSDDTDRTIDLPIALGETYRYDIEVDRDPDALLSDWAYANGITLMSTTDMTVTLNELVQNCTVITNGACTDTGQNNSVN